MKYTFLSKWTVLILTVATAAATVFGIRWTFGDGSTSVGAGILLLIVGLVVYAIAWIIALLDSLQERHFGWSIILVVLLPFFVGPAIYGLIGPKNTK